MAQLLNSTSLLGKLADGKPVATTCGDVTYIVIDMAYLYHGAGYVLYERPYMAFNADPFTTVRYFPYMTELSTYLSLHAVNVDAGWFIA